MVGVSPSKPHNSRNANAVQTSKEAEEAKKLLPKEDRLKAEEAQRKIQDAAVIHVAGSINAAGAALPTAAAGDLAATLQASGQFTKFLAAAEKTGLGALLKGTRELTLFVPTDVAFDALPAGEHKRWVELPEAMSMSLSARPTSMALSRSPTVAVMPWTTETMSSSLVGRVDRRSDILPIDALAESAEYPRDCMTFG